MSVPFHGVNQCYVLAPTLFSIMASDIYANVCLPGKGPIHRHQNCTDVKLFNQRRLQANTKIYICILREFLFADDCALIAVNAAYMQHTRDLMSVHLLWQLGIHHQYKDDTSINVPINAREVIAINNRL